MNKSAKVKNKTFPEFQNQFYLPKFWGIWLGVGLLRLLAFVPFSWKFGLGKFLGKTLYIVSTKRRRLVLANLALCFPEKNQNELHELLKQHFDSLGIALMEMTIVWWGDHKKNHENAFERSIVKFTGEQNLRHAQAQGNGVLILAPHFTTLELTGLFVSFLTNYHAVYRPHDNPLMDYIIAKGRSIQFSNGEHVEPVSNANTRLMLKVLRAGKSMTFLPDQRYRSKGHVTVPFFGVMSKSNPATSKISKMTGCAVVPTFTRRLENHQYEVEFLPALDNFPSGDDYQDTLRLHQLYEAEIRRNPSQYLWVHNRWNLKEY
ncbi:lysophospholipid acyltransferase family protein [Thiomicrorhabdus lithotrophica]|uniref:Lysophospholipid acyltransferase family protein n=1 Tax=Thiomicrorhabdus lithotrophica TaxID=2949997 RepID=A0ABY8C841_9GAMM|nr:lysophospholipid acyltransferase family protein [Thiomicrorhabdus lithotrophica]WEJ62136.1 lysophospholipid acyltransferase family protein [Thiomicrorhabdus lithotrophica]